MYTRRDVTTDEARGVYMLITVRRPVRPAARPTREHVSKGYAGSLEIHCDDVGHDTPWGESIQWMHSGFGVFS